MKKILLVLPLATLIGCASTHIEMKADGTTTIDGFVLGNTTALTEGTTHLKTPTIERTFTVEGLKNDQVEALKQINQLVGSIVQGAAQGAK